VSETYGITTIGFNPKMLDVIEENFKELLVDYFGSNVDLSQLSPLWKTVQVVATEATLIWTQAEQLFYNNFIATAEGSALDLKLDDVGLERKPAIAAGVTLTIYKNTDNSVTVPQYSLFETTEGVQFFTDIEIQIAAGAKASTTGSVSATAAIAGIAGNVAQNTITTPTSTITGVDYCNNASIAEGGEEKETDSAARKRARDYVGAIWTAAAIRSAALNVSGVDGVKIIEFTTSYNCLIVPKTTFSAALQTSVEEAIEKVTAITVEFSVLESESVGLIIAADITIETTYDEISAEADAEVEVREYLQTLGIDDDVFKAKVTQAIMETAGILNVYNLVLLAKPINETHRYLTASGYTYNLDYSTGTDSASVIVKGTVGGTPDTTFTKTTDYTIGTSPARVIFTGTGDLPDNDTDFYVTYTYPANAIGDIEINQDDIAIFDSINFTVP